jgi:hypothetical protein
LTQLHIVILLTFSCSEACLRVSNDILLFSCFDLERYLFKSILLFRCTVRMPPLRLESSRGLFRVLRSETFPCIVL